MNSVGSQTASAVHLGQNSSIRVVFNDLEQIVTNEGPMLIENHGDECDDCKKENRVELDCSDPQCKVLIQQDIESGLIPTELNERIDEVNDIHDEMKKDGQVEPFLS